jgi:hypothetical protein
MDQDNVKECERINVESVGGRWLMKQLSSYDTYRQRVVVLVIDEDTIFSDVFWCPDKMSDTYYS